MQNIDIEGLEVKFPFAPYGVQVNYMRAVAKALTTGATALLESPTGTGKTLCLLCCALAWVEYRNNHKQLPRVPGPSVKVIYCSRTHSQLSQVMGELRSSPYAHLVAAVLGSKEHFCVNPEVVQLPNATSRTHTCNVLRSENRCRYFNSFRFTRRCNPTSNGVDRDEAPIMDMEDLVQLGKRESFCPYYSERERSKQADIVFMPYNYIIDPSLRKQLPFPVDKDCVIIIDEAHNLPSVLSADGCVNLSAVALANAIQDCGRAMAMLNIDVDSGPSNGEAKPSSSNPKISEQDVAALKIVLKKLESHVIGINLTPSADARPTPYIQAPGELVYDGAHVYHFLEGALISSEVYFGSAEALGMKVILAEAISLLSKSDRSAGGMAAVQTFLDVVFDTELDCVASVKFVIQEQTGRDLKKKVSRSIGFWRLDSVEMLRLQESVLSLLLTSGTLSPLEHFAAELGLQCDVQLRGTHVIETDQLMASVLPRGPGGEKLNGSYAFRSNTDYRRGLGMSILNLCRHVDGGSLVFFPSYAALYGAVDLWRAGSGETDQKTIWGLLSETKPVFLEPMDNADLATVVEKFKETVDTQPSGAMLLAVCRGKISEGVNFSDGHGRCVVVTGIPYANATDLFVRLKRKYLTDMSSRRPKVNGKHFTGEDWYRNEAMRAVSQCVGRVIRHKDDFGAIVLADERFRELTPCLPEWIKPSLVLGLHFRDTYAAVVQFFSHRRLRLRSTRRSFPGETQRDGASPVPLRATSTLSEESIQKARDYMDAQREQQLISRAQQEQRRRLAENEGTAVPLASASAPSRTTLPFRITPLRRPCLPGANEAFSNTETAAPKIVKQVLPVRTADTNLNPVAERRTGFGSTSKEFCAFLKARLTSAHYDTFKIVLAEIAALRRAPRPETFRLAVTRLRDLFEHIPDFETSALLVEFSRYIPEELRASYTTELIRLSLKR